MNIYLYHIIANNYLEINDLIDNLALNPGLSTDISIVF